jgi:hypothetical protein
MSSGRQRFSILRPEQCWSLLEIASDVCDGSIAHIFVAFEVGEPLTKKCNFDLRPSRETLAKQNIYNYVNLFQVLAPPGLLMESSAVWQITDCQAGRYDLSCHLTPAQQREVIPGPLLSPEPNAVQPLFKQLICKCRPSPY